MAIQSALKVGVDVPWVTSWTDEPVLGVRACPTASGRPALCQADHAGFGKPLYSQNHLVRQRLSVTRMLCPMCGRPTSAEDRWTQTAKRRPAGRLRIQGVALPADIGDDQVVIDTGGISPLHRACAERSMKQCPHLRADPELELRKFPARWSLIPLMVQATDPVTGRVLGVVGFLQLCGITATVDRRWRAVSASQ